MNISPVTFGISKRERVALKNKAEADKTAAKTGSKKVATEAFVPQGRVKTRKH